MPAAAGRPAVKTFTVTVADITPPVITSITANPSVINRNNHKMQSVTVTAAATDNSGPTTSRISAVTSDEPLDGTGDGDTSPDWVIKTTGWVTTGSPMLVDLRAERAQSGDGRVYTIYIECKDAAGNVATGTVTVFVPKN